MKLERLSYIQLDRPLYRIGPIIQEAQIDEYSIQRAAVIVEYHHAHQGYWTCLYI